MTGSRTLLLIALALVPVSPAAGAERCSIQDTLHQCWARHFPAQTAEQEEAVETAAEDATGTTDAAATKELRSQPTGVETGGLNLGSNTKNLLPLMAFSGLLGQGSEGTEEGTFVFDVNFLLPFLAEDKNTQLQAVLNNEPEISSVVEDALPEEGDDDVRETLGDGLDGFDDATLSLTYSHARHDFGRGFEHYRDRWDTMVEAAHVRARQRLTKQGATHWSEIPGLDPEMHRLASALESVDDPGELTFLRMGEASCRLAASADPQEVIEPAAERAEAEERTGEEPENAMTGEVAPVHATPDLEATLRAIQETLAEIQASVRQPDDPCPASEAQRLMALIEASAQTAAIDFEVHREEIESARLGAWVDLLANQRQLLVGVKKRFRDPRVGPDEISYSLSFEWGPANLNRALGGACRQELDRLTPNAADVEICLSRFSRFVKDNEDAIEHSDRFSFSAEYVDVEEESFDLAEADLMGLRYAGATKWTWSAAASRLFRPGEGDEPIRVDFKADYEDVSDDPMRRDRLIASLTMTRKIAGVSVPFGIVYANHGEFLPEVDERVSAHIGLKFDLFGQPAEE